MQQRERDHKKEANTITKGNKHKNNTVAEMDTASNEVINRLNTARGKINELEDRPPYWLY